jgi:hypothetical protein
MTPEQREELKKAAEKLVAARSAPKHIFNARLEEYREHAPAFAILSLIAQVEALTVPQCYLVGAYTQYDGTASVRAFAQEADSIAFAAACNAYEAIRPAFKSEAEAAWIASHPAREHIGCDSFEVELVPFGLPTISAVPGTKGDAPCPSK